jgi:competence ComEA-like helix-hairpin-helix protein
MRKFFSRFVNAYFSFLQKDRIGVLTLSIFVLIMIAGHVIINHINLIPRSDFTEFKHKLENWENNHLDQNVQALFVFDPNMVTEGKLDCLAVPSAIKSNMLRYRAAGGRFVRAEDIRKIYGMNDSIFLILKPYIQIENISTGMLKKHEKDDAQTKPDNLKDDTEKDLVRVNDEPLKTILSLIELNSADSAELTCLKGIGPVYASRIIKYRNLLGGFYSENQLLEVYGFKEETFNRVKDFIIVDTTKIKKLRINFVDYTDLVRHPYVKENHVESILNYRRLNGPFTFLEQLVGNELMDSITFNVLKPYLTCR